MTPADRRRAKLIAREASKPGLRGKINAMCISCLYCPGDGGGSWVSQISACTAYSCPLFDVRPGAKAGEQSAA